MTDTVTPERTAAPTDWVAVIRDLGPDFASRGAAHDADDGFVAENYAALKDRDFFAAGVPSELGGGGASYGEIAASLRELAHHDGATALACSMHTHNVQVLAYLWRHGNEKVAPLLRRVAAEKLVLLSSGGSDWLPGSGTLTKVDGGYRMSGTSR